LLLNYLHRPGFKTSEFLVSVLAVVGSIVAWTQDYISSGTGTKLSVGAGLVYVLSRGLAKYEPRGVPPVVVSQPVVHATTAPPPPPGG
jgi:hypothetical protein